MFLLVVAIISGAVCITSLLGSPDTRRYVQSGRGVETCRAAIRGVGGLQFYGAGHDETGDERIRLERMFETDGSYSPDKLVDVVEYTKSGRISGEEYFGCGVYAGGTGELERGLQ